MTILKSPKYTIAYKSFRLYFTNILYTRTFQKSQNLYIYLHYTSAHANTGFKALILGECVRYVRRNTFNLHCHGTRIQRVRRRDYPHQLIRPTSTIIKYHQDRHLHLQRSQPTHLQITPPLFKCLPPPQFKALKNIILRNNSTSTAPLQPSIYCTTTSYLTARLSPSQDHTHR